MNLTAPFGQIRSQECIASQQESNVVVFFILRTSDPPRTRPNDSIVDSWKAKGKRRFALRRQQTKLHLLLPYHFLEDIDLCLVRERLWASLLRQLPRCHGNCFSRTAFLHCRLACQPSFDLSSSSLNVGMTGAREQKTKVTNKEAPAALPRPAGTVQQSSGGGQIPVQRGVGPGTGQHEQQRMLSSLDIQLVQSLIERCLQLYMSKREVLAVLEQQAKIEPGFTGLVWQQLEEQNPDFFKVYHGRLRLKDQIVVFNQLIESHYHILRASPRSALQLGQPPYGQARQQPGVQLQDGQPISAQQPQLRTSPPCHEELYDQRQGGSVVLRDERSHQGETPRDRIGGAPTTGNESVSDPHGDLGKAQGAHGEGLLAKENNFIDFNASGGLTALPHENDGLMGGLNNFPRNFSLSDLSMDLQQSNDGEQTLNLLSSLQDGSEAYGLVAPSETNDVEIKRNFSLSDVNLEM